MYISRLFCTSFTNLHGLLHVRLLEHKKSVAWCSQDSTTAQRLLPVFRSSSSMDRLQSVQNAAARLIFRARRHDHVRPLLSSLHWLRVTERISFRLAVLVYRCLHDSAPGYLASDLQRVRVSDLGARRRLRSSSTSALVAPRTVRATIGDRAFPAAAASVWKSLPETLDTRVLN